MSVRTSYVPDHVIAVTNAISAIVIVGEVVLLREKLAWFEGAQAHV